MVRVPPRFWASTGAAEPRRTAAARAVASTEQSAVRSRVIGGSPLSSGLQQRHERIEVLPVHLTTAVLEAADDLDEGTRLRHGHPERLALARQHAELAVDFRLALAHREIPPDARL